MSKDIYQSIDETEEILCEEYHPHESSIQAAIQEMPSDDELFDLAETFKIFGDSTRIRIICALLPGEMCVCDLSDLLGISQSAISHQLRLLRASRLVKNRREGKSIYYSLDDQHIYSIISQGLKHSREEDHHEH